MEQVLSKTPIVKPVQSGLDRPHFRCSGEILREKFQLLMELQRGVSSVEELKRRILIMLLHVTTKRKVVSDEIEEEPKRSEPEELARVFSSQFLQWNIGEISGNR